MGKTAFVFPGQASQFVGMGHDLYDRSSLAKDRYDYAEERFDFPLKEISFHGPLKSLTETEVTQPAIFVLSVILFEELKARNCFPDMVAGHSLGEYSALVAAEALTFEAGLDLVKVRAEQMQQAGEEHPGTMAAIVGLDIDTVRKVLESVSTSGICQVANHNSSNQIAISGEINAVHLSMEALKDAGARRVVELVVGGAFHSSLMADAGKELLEVLRKVNILEPKYPVYTNVTGTATRDPETIRQYLYEQLVSPVLWVDTITNMHKDGTTRFVEVGPGRVLQGLIKRIVSDAEIAGISSYDELEAFECS